jgi:PAS domain S-box-containing protein/putative nucleotidyltransferase with HDIG domain
MAKPLAVLIVEDMESDAQLLVRMLTKAGYTLTYERVDTAAQIRRALEKQPWEIVISDFSMPGLDGFAALKVFQEAGLDIPFIAVSGTMGEETAVAMMKAGAHDYVMKGNLARLAPAIERELKQAETRREARLVEHQKQERVKELRTLFGLSMIIEREGITLDEVYQELTNILPAGWQYPEISCARIVVRGREFCTKNFKESAWIQSTPIKVDGTDIGKIEVGYLEKRLDEVEGPFLLEERELIEAIAERLGRFIENKQTEDALRASEKQHRTILETAMDGFWLVDMQGGLLEVNETYCRMSGYTEQELLTMSIPDLEDKETPGDTASHIQKILEQGEDCFESRHRRKDGSFFYVEISVQYRAEDGGQFVAFLQDITERKNAAGLLKESADRLNDAQKLAHIGVWDWKPDTDTVTWTEELYQIAGLDPLLPAPTYMEQSNIYTPESWEFLKTSVEKAMETGESYQLELKLIRPNGDIRYVNAFGGAKYDSKGQVNGLFGTVQDITERKRAEEKLRESEELFTLFLKHSPIYAYIKAVTPSESRNLKFSDNFQDMLGIPVSEMVGKTMDELFPADIAAKMTADEWAVVTKREVLRLNEDFNGRNYTSIKFPVIQGDKTLLAGYTIDITERKRVEQKLEEERNLLRTVIDNLPIRVYAMDDQGRKTLSNTEDWQASGGKTMEDVIGKTDFDTYPPELAKDFWALDKQVIDSGESILDREEPGLDSHGNRILVLSSKVPLRNSQGEIIGLVRIGQDITERKQAEILQDALYRITQASDLCENLDALYPAIHAIIQEVMVADNFYIALHDENHDLLRFPYSVDEVDPVVAPLKPGKGLTAYVLRTAKSLLCDESLFEDLKQRGEVDLIGAQSEIWLGVPLLVEGKVVGVMAIQDYKNADAYGERELRILEFVSSQVAIAIHRKQAEEQLRDSEARYRALFQGSADGILIADLESMMFRYANPAICRMLGYSEAELQKMGVSDIHPKADLPAVMAEFEAQASGEKMLAEGIPCLRKDGTIIYADVSAIAMSIYGKASLGGFFRDITDRKQAEKEIQSLARFPSENPGPVLRIALDGTLLYINPNGLSLLPEWHLQAGQAAPPMLREAALQTIKDETIKALDLEYGERVYSFHVAPIIAAGYANLYGHDITERRIFDEKLRKTVVGTVNTIALIVEARDPYTAGHQKRVSEISVAIAKELGLPEEQIQGIYFASLVHDVGKIQVPSEILSKPGKLTKLEFELIKTHSEVGYKLLKEIEFPWPIAEIVYQHHERMDGSGYPRKLKGKHILIEAKIISLADVIEAMSSHRPYRPALGLDAAVDEINKNKGILYDADIVEAFLKVIEKDESFIFSPKG